MRSASRQPAAIARRRTSTAREAMSLLDASCSKGGRTDADTDSDAAAGIPLVCA
jgi:hypothetical protein